MDVPEPPIVTERLRTSRSMSAWTEQGFNADQVATCPFGHTVGHWLN